MSDYDRHDHPRRVRLTPEGVLEEPEKFHRLVDTIHLHGAIGLEREAQAGLLPEAEQFSEIVALDWSDLLERGGFEFIEPPKVPAPEQYPRHRVGWLTEWCRAVYRYHRSELRYRNGQTMYLNASEHRYGFDPEAPESHVRKFRTDNAPDWAVFGRVEASRYYRVTAWPDGAEELRAVLVRSVRDTGLVVLIQQLIERGHYVQRERRDGTSYRKWVPYNWATVARRDVSSESDGHAVIDHVTRQWVLDQQDADERYTNGWDWHPDDIPWDPMKFPQAFLANALAESEDHEHIQDPAIQVLRAHGSRTWDADLEELFVEQQSWTR